LVSQLIYSGWDV